MSSLKSHTFEIILNDFVQRYLGTLAFLNFCFISAILFVVTDHSCAAIAGYHWTIQFGIGAVFVALGVLAVKSMLGIGIFLVVQSLWRKRLGAYYDRFRLLYGFVFAIVLFYPGVREICRNIFFSGLKAEICSKSEFNGMVSVSNGLNLEEYKFLQEEFFMLPDLPASTHDIDIQYYHDNFLGEYNLRVHIVCEKSESLKAEYGTWSVDPDEHLNANEKVAIYHESQM